MTRVNITFHAALFAISFVICGFVAVLSISRKPDDKPERSYESSSEGMVLSSHGNWGGGDTSSYTSRGAGMQSTPLPDQYAHGKFTLPSTPVAGSSGGRMGMAVEADYQDSDAEPSRSSSYVSDTGNPDDMFSKAMAIYATRNVGLEASRDGEDLPVVTMAELDTPDTQIAQATTPAGSGYIATEKATVAPSDSKSLKNMPQGYVIGRDGVRAAKQAPPMASDRPFEMVDISGKQDDFSSTRAEEILRRYSTEDLPPPVPTAPPIALPDELRPKAFTPTPTPGILQRSRNVPRHLVRTPLPMLSNLSGETSTSGDGKFPFATDAGKVPFAASFEDPRKRSERRINETIAESAPPQAAAASGDFSEREAPPAAPAEPIPNIPAATPGTYTVKKGKAEVSFSNVPPGWIRPDKEAAEETPGGKPAPVATAAGAQSNAGAAPSPTPNFDTGMDTPAVARGKWQLPPAPTLPPKLIAPDDGKKKSTPTPAGGKGSTTEEISKGSASDAEVASADANAGNVESLLESKLADGSLPPDVARKLSGAVAQGFASVGDRVLSSDETRRRVEAALALRGNPKLSRDERDTLERRIADDWTERTAIAEEARRNKMTITDDEVRQYQEKQKQRMGGQQFEAALKSAGFTDGEIFAEMRESAIAEKYVDAVFKSTITDQMMRAAYQRSPDKFQPSRRFHVMEISRTIPPGGSSNAQRVEREMKALLNRLKRGEDFSALAREVSDAPSKSDGGDLGWIDASSNISEDMARALVPLKPGQHSDVVKVEDSYKILKLVEMEEPKPGFEGAREKMEVAARENVRLGIYESAKANFQIKIGTRAVKPKSATDTKSGSRAVVQPR